MQTGQPSSPHTTDGWQVRVTQVAGQGGMGGQGGIGRQGGMGGQGGTGRVAWATPGLGS